MRRATRPCGALPVLMPEPEREPVFIAANVREADFVEELLDEAGIEYEEKLEAFTRDDVSSAVCYQGTLFEGSRGTGGILPKVIDGQGARTRHRGTARVDGAQITRPDTAMQMWRGDDQCSVNRFLRPSGTSHQIPFKIAQPRVVNGFGVESKYSWADSGTRCVNL